MNLISPEMSTPNREYPPRLSYFTQVSALFKKVNHETRPLNQRIDTEGVAKSIFKYSDAAYSLE